ncbi:MAG: hypothetical protein ACI9FN_001520 [Saprospiraceae bacterium]|jgi:hypothetical protein
MLLIFSCSDSDEVGVFDASFSGTYNYSVIISCFCSTDYVGPNSIVLVDGVVEKYNGNDVSIDDTNYDLIQSLGLDDLIQQAERFIDQDPIQQNIEYHPDYGFIENCYFDESEQIADEEWGYTITDFEVL